MTREEQIKILMEDRCTRYEAERYVNTDHVIIWENPADYIECLKECGCYEGETVEDVTSGKLEGLSMVGNYLVEYIL